VKVRKNEYPDVIFDSINYVRYKRDALLGKGAFAKCFQITNTNTENVITHHQELFYEQFVKLRVASQYALKL
jgi:hypothetical protein